MICLAVFSRSCLDPFYVKRHKKFCINCINLRESELVVFKTASAEQDLLLKSNFDPVLPTIESDLLQAVTMQSNMKRKRVMFLDTREILTGY